MLENDSRTDLYNRMYCECGELIPPRLLWRMLGYTNAGALRSARNRGILPVETFQIPGRRGSYARTRDVVNWLSQLGSIKTGGGSL